MCWQTGIVHEKKDKSYVIHKNKDLFISRNHFDLRPTNFLIGTNNSKMDTKAKVNPLYTNNPVSTSKQSEKWTDT